MACSLWLLADYIGLVSQCLRDFSSQVLVFRPNLVLPLRLLPYWLKVYSGIHVSVALIYGPLLLDTRLARKVRAPYVHRWRWIKWVVPLTVQI